MVLYLFLFMSRQICSASHHIVEDCLPDRHKGESDAQSENKEEKWNSNKREWFHKFQRWIGDD